MTMTRERWAELEASFESQDGKGFMELAELANELFCYARELREDHIDFVKDAFMSGSAEATGCFAGWYDTLGFSELCDYGDELVEAGKFEKHPDGYGRRQFYRPIEKKP